MCKTQSGPPSTAKHLTHALTFNPDIPFKCPAYKPATHSSPPLWPSNHHHSGPDVHTGARDPQLQRARKRMEWTQARPPWVSPLRLSRAKTDRSAIVPAQPTDLLNHAGLLASPLHPPAPTPTGSPPNTHEGMGWSPPTTKRLHLVLGALHPQTWFHPGPTPQGAGR